jgi:hypothetical protein
VAGRSYRTLGPSASLPAGAALAAPDFVSLNSRADAAYVVNDALIVMNRNSGIVAGDVID